MNTQLILALITAAVFTDCMTSTAYAQFRSRKEAEVNRCARLHSRWQLLRWRGRRRSGRMVLRGIYRSNRHTFPRATLPTATPQPQQQPQPQVQGPLPQVGGPVQPQVQPPPRSPRTALGGFGYPPPVLPPQQNQQQPQFQQGYQQQPQFQQGYQQQPQVIVQYGTVCTSTTMQGWFAQVPAHPLGTHCQILTPHGVLDGEVTHSEVAVPETDRWGCTVEALVATPRR